MSIAEVQRIHIIAHSGVKLEVLSSLQEQGVVQVEKANFEELNLKSSLTEVAEVEHKLHRLSHSLNYLSRWEEKGLAKRLFAQKPQLDPEKKKDLLNFDYLPILDDVEKLEDEINELLSEIRF